MSISQLAVLALLLVTAQYAAAQKEYADRKLKRTAIMQELEALQAENKPFDDSQKYVSASSTSILLR